MQVEQWRLDLYRSACLCLQQVAIELSPHIRSHLMHCACQPDDCVVFCGLLSVLSQLVYISYAYVSPDI